MRILILFSQPWRIGGAETHVQALIQGLYDNNHCVYLAVNQGSDAARVAALRRQFPELPVLTIQARGINLFGWGADLLRLACLIKDEKIKVVAAQQRTAGLWAWVLKKLTGAPFTVTVHDAWHRALGKRYYKYLFQHVIVVSRHLAERMQRDFDMAVNDIAIVHNGIDFQQFQPLDRQAARQQLNLDPHCKLLLHVSRLSSVKGAVGLKLLDCVPALMQWCNSSKLIIIGEGPLRAQLEQQTAVINQQYGNVVEIRNFTADIATWYAAADVLIGEGRVAIEALACLTPVVAIRNGISFLGAVTSDNIQVAIDENFDAAAFPVKAEQLAMQIQQADCLTVAERQGILAQVKQRMSIAAMTDGYCRVFQNSTGAYLHEQDTAD